MISVIIPVYNGERYLLNCINMLKQQEYGDFQAIFVNDGSTDKSREVFEKFTKDDDRFQMINIENHGVSYARNLGMQYVKGDYFTFIDCDDYIPKDYFFYLMSYIRKDIDAVFCKINIMDENLNVLKTQSCEEKIYNSEEILFKLLEFKNLNSGPCGKVISSKYLSNKIEFPKLKIYEDLVFNIDLIKEMKDSNIYFTDKTFYGYIHRESMGAMANFKKSPTIDVIIAMEYAFKAMERMNLEIQEYDYLFYRILSQIMMYACDLSIEIDKSFINRAKRVLRKHFLSLIKNKSINRNEKKMYIIFMISFKLYKEISRRFL